MQIIAERLGIEALVQKDALTAVLVDDKYTGTVDNYPIRLEDGLHMIGAPQWSHLGHRAEDEVYRNGDVACGEKGPGRCRSIMPGIETERHPADLPGLGRAQI